jgi:hydrogenase-4 component F
VLCVLFVGFALWRRRDATRFFALAAVGQAGMAVFAFGVGSPVARFAGLLHVALFTLTTTAILICVDAAARRRGGRRFADLRGLTHTHKPLGATLAVGIVALAGLPPLGPCTSLFLIGTETVLRVPWLALPLGAGLVAGGWALLARLQRLCLAPPPSGGQTGNGPAVGVPEMVPAWMLLAVAIALGVAMPPPVAAWLRDAAQ